MVKTVFLVVPRRIDGVSTEGMTRLVDDVKGYVFGSWAEVVGFALGRCYGKGQVMTSRELAEWINNPTTSGQVGNKLVFPMSYKGGSTNGDN